jgi:hypothetical protein
MAAIDPHMAAIDPHPYQLISEELYESMRSIHDDPNPSEMDSKAASKTLTIVQRIHDKNARDKIRQLAHTLKKSHSTIDQAYADRVISAVTEHERLSSITKTLSNMFGKAIKGQFEALLLPDNDPRKQAAQKETEDTFHTFDKICAEGLPLPEYSPFLKEYSVTHTDLTSAKKEFEDTLLNLPAVFKTMPPLTQVLVFATMRSKVEQLYHEVAELFNQEKSLISSCYMMNREPIKLHIQFIKDLIALASNPNGVDRTNIQELEKTKDTLARSEPEFTRRYLELWNLFTTPTFSSVKFIDKARDLGSALIAKANQNIVRIRKCIQEIKTDTATAASEKISKLRCRTCSKEESSTVQLPNAFKKCGRCMQVFYCSEECQEKDWPRHKKECHPPQTSKK